MAKAKNENKKNQDSYKDYSRFNKVDGRHQLQKSSPDSGKSGRQVLNCRLAAG